jgi:hypothetical protein
MIKIIRARLCSILVLLFATILLAVSSPSSISADTVSTNEGTIKISLDGQYISSDVAPVIENGYTLVPVRVITEKLGAEVAWNGNDRSIAIKTGTKHIQLSIDNKQAIINSDAGSNTVQLQAAPFIKDEKAMVPLRFIAEELGLQVNWDDVQRTIFLVSSVKETAVQDSVKVSSKIIEDNNDISEVKLSIPQLDGLKAKEIQDSINQGFENKALQFKEETFASLEEYVTEAKKQGWPIRPYAAVSNYQVTYSKGNLLSLYTDYYGYTGGAHGFTDRVASNLDLATGKELHLKDLFKTGFDYKAVINQEIKRQMQLDPDKYFPETLTDWQGISEDQRYYIEDGNLVIYFPLYELAPYACGIPEFKIPFTTLELDL